MKVHKKAAVGRNNHKQNSRHGLDYATLTEEESIELQGLMEESLKVKEDYWIDQGFRIVYQNDLISVYYNQHNQHK